MLNVQKTFYTLLFLLSVVIFNGCSSIEMGFEKNSIFHSEKVKQETIETSIVNVYLSPSTSKIDKFRLIINGEDTELDLYYNVITRFGVDKKNTVIDLLRNNKRVMSIKLLLADEKNYYLVVKKDLDSGYFVIQKIDKNNIKKGIQATPIFVSEEAVAEEKLQNIKKVQEIQKQEKQDVIIKRNIEHHEINKTQRVEKIQNTEVKEKKVSKKNLRNKSLQKKYESGETIFYYDPDDGE